MPTWTIKADRRRADYDRLVERLQSLQNSVRGLTLTLVDVAEFDSSPDAGNFRDFAPVAHLTHTELQALEIVAEELVIEFGWLIDLDR